MAILQLIAGITLLLWVSFINVTGTKTSGQYMFTSFVLRLLPVSAAVTLIMSGFKALGWI